MPIFQVFVVLSVAVALVAGAAIDSESKKIEKRGLYELEDHDDIVDFDDHHVGKEVTITKKVPVYIEKKVPVYVEKKVHVPVDRPVYVPYKVPVEVPVVHKEYVEVPKPYAVHVAKPYPVVVKKHIYVEKPVGLSVHIKHRKH